MPNPHITGHREVLDRVRRMLEGTSDRALLHDTLAAPTPPALQESSAQFGTSLREAGRQMDHAADAFRYFITVLNVRGEIVEIPQIVTLEVAIPVLTPVLSLRRPWRRIVIDEEG